MDKKASPGKAAEVGAMAGRGMVYLARSVTNASFGIFIYGFLSYLIQLARPAADQSEQLHRIGQLKILVAFGSLLNLAGQMMQYTGNWLASVNTQCSIGNLIALGSQKFEYLK